MQAPGGRQRQRLEMLINVAVQGDKKLKKLATEAKRVAMESKNLGKGQDVLGKSMTDMKADTAKTIAQMKELERVEKDLKRNEEALAKATHSNGRAMKGQAEKVKLLRSARSQLRKEALGERKELKRLSGIYVQLDKTTRRVVGGTKTLRQVKDKLNRELTREIRNIKD